MFRQAVGLHAFVALAVDEVFGNFPSGATDATVTVDHNALSFDEPRFQEWDQGDLNAGWIASGQAIKEAFFQLSSASSGMT